MGARFGLMGLVTLAAVMLAPAAGGEIYSWRDASGRTHYTQNLDDVPRRQREAAAAAASSRVRLQTYSNSHSSASELPASTGAAMMRMPASRPGAGGTIRVPFERRGTLMRVDVKLNDRVTAPFLVDTGASGISIPYAVAQQLGLRITSDTPRRTAITANGMVSEPVVRLMSVQLGGARVENLEASVSGSMDVGLLGGTFFNNFVYQVDSASGVILLTPNGRVVSGLTEEQWRARFREIREPLGRLDAALERGGFLDESRVRELQQRQTELRQALEELEIQASRSRVPQNWRR